jgi:hypothetical protein
MSTVLFRVPFAVFSDHNANANTGLAIASLASGGYPRRADQRSFPGHGIDISRQLRSMLRYSDRMPGVQSCRAYLPLALLG